jgi:hypothetical protein
LFGVGGWVCRSKRYDYFRFGLIVRKKRGYLRFLNSHALKDKAIQLHNIVKWFSGDGIEKCTLVREKGHY